MRVIIAGTRDGCPPHELLSAIRAFEARGFSITEVVSGCARGVDTMGERWARARGIPVAPFPADWDRFGLAAGAIRNTAMAAYADALIALPAYHSRGTLDMIERARRRHLPTYVRIVGPIPHR